MPVPRRIAVVRSALGKTGRVHMSIVVLRIMCLNRVPCCQDVFIFLKRPGRICDVERGIPLLQIRTVSSDKGYIAQNKSAEVRVQRLAPHDEGLGNALSIKCICNQSYPLSTPSETAINLTRRQHLRQTCARQHVASSRWPPCAS